MKLLKYKEDRRSIAFVLVYAALVVTGFVFHEEMVVWQRVALVVVTALAAFFQAVMVHNNIHVPMFHSRRLNRVWQYVNSVSYGAPMSAFVRGHNLSHHHYVQTPKDVMRTTKARFRWNLLNQLLFPAIVAPAITKGNRIYVKKMRTERPRWFWQYSREFVVVWSTMITLAVINWQAFLLYFLIPHLYGVWGIIGINFLQHDGVDHEHEYNHSRNFVGGLVNWFCFNNGFHGMHHLKPNMHWSKLPAAHAELVAPHVHPALDQPSLIAYILRTYVWPGRRITYDGKPLVLGPVQPDENWAPTVSETPMGVSLGAEA